MLDTIEVHPPFPEDAQFGSGRRWALSSGYALQFTKDGNLEVRNPAGVVVWESGTGGLGARRLAITVDGDLAIFGGAGNPVWSSGTAGNPGAFLAIQADGNVVIYSADRRPLWESDTNGK